MMVTALSYTAQTKREVAFENFMERMENAEKSIREQGYYTEEDMEREMDKI